MNFVKLADIIKIEKGKKNQIVDMPTKESVRLIQIDDLRNDSNIKYTNEKNGVSVNENDLLIVWDGANAGTVGYGKSGYIGSTIAALKIKDEQYNTEYLGKYLNTQFGYLQSNSTGATIPHVSRIALENIKVPVISFKDQVRIASLLSRIEGLIDKRKESIALLDEYVKSVFLEMFGDPVRNEKGWERKPFSMIGDFISGGTPSKEQDEYWNGTFPWVSPKDMKVSYLFDSQDHVSDKVFIETSLKKIEAGCILIVVRGMILAHSFPVAINMVSVSINQDMKAIQLMNGINAHYIMNCLKCMKRLILSSITTAGHGTKRFDSDVMNNVLVPLPPMLLQKEYADIVEKIEAIKVKYQESLSELEKLYGSVSQRAFRGEI